MESIISINNLNFSYSPGKSVLKDVSLEIAKGETFGIIGRTGAGKSTLLLHLNGLLKGSEGSEIKVAGIPVTPKTEKDIREKVGIVFQNPDNQLFCPTVYEDIAFGLFNSGYSKQEVESRVNAILEKMDLVDLRDMSSHHVSFGEKKRISLASILVMEPEILCFDEPFANLDYNSIFNFIKEIRNLQITRIIISQDILLAMALCDRIAVMHHGEVLRIAPAKEIAQDHEFLKEIGIDYQPYLELIRELL